MGFLALYGQRWTPLWEEAENYSSLPGHRRTVKWSTWSHLHNNAKVIKCQTFMRWSTWARSCVLMESLQYSLSPGLATSRMANSLWNISTAHLDKSSTLSGATQKIPSRFPTSPLPEERPVQQELEDERRWNLQHQKEAVRNHRSLMRRIHRFQRPLPGKAS